MEEIINSFIDRNSIQYVTIPTHYKSLPFIASYLTNERKPLQEVENISVDNETLNEYYYFNFKSPNTTSICVYERNIFDGDYMVDYIITKHNEAFKKMSYVFLEILRKSKSFRYSEGISGEIFGKTLTIGFGYSRVISVSDGDNTKHIKLIPPKLNTHTLDMIHVKRKYKDFLINSALELIPDIIPEKYLLDREQIFNNLFLL